MSGADPIRELRAWQRFHLRITAIYAVVVLVMLTAAAVVAYALAWSATMAQLRERMEVAALGLAQGIDGARVAAVDPAAPDPALVDELRERFSTVAQGDPSISTIYVLLWDPDPSRLVFVADVNRIDPNEVGRPGERYDASELPVMLQGFDALAVEEEPYVDEWGPSISAYAPIRGPGGERLALVGVDVRVDELWALRRQVLLTTAGAWLVAIGLIAAASVVVGRNVRDPLTRVIDGTARIARGSFDTRLRLERSDEFGLMARHFDLMAEGLEERERIRDTFGLYMAPDVARALLASADGPQLGGEVREVTVVFVDLRGYSTISELLTPPRIVALLNRWLGAMQEVLDAEQGTVIEFLGDAILAVFGAPAAMDDHPERAVRCALGMQRALERLNAEPVRDAPELAMRIGVHTGTVVAGNVGSATRLKYTVIGDAVNVAARLESLNKELGTDILVSGATLARVPEGVARATDHGEIVVKGRTEPVRVYAIDEP